MSISQEERKSLNLLRRMIPAGYKHLSKRFMDMSIGIMNLLADKKCGPKERRIGVFGPYPNGGRKIIDNVAKILCEFGFVSITADGFYLPNNCDVFYNINEIMNNPVHMIKNLLPGHIFFYHFPRLVEKAIFFENDERGQVIELNGCHDHNIPCLGFILHKKFFNHNNCIFLKLKNGYSLCDATSKQLCYHKGLPMFCPFYDSINIPWFTKQIFFTDENHLVATENLEDLKPAIKEFISN